MKKTISPIVALTLSLSVVLMVAMLAAIITSAFVPNVILPRLTVPTFAGLSLIALALEALVFGEGRRYWIASAVVAAVDFALLGLCAGLLPGDPVSVGKAAVLGMVVFLVCEMLFHSILDRLSSGPVKNRKSLAVFTALLLFLASQILEGIGL